MSLFRVTGDQWIPLTKGQSHGKCFHLMTSSWCSEDTQTTYLTLQQLGHYSSNFVSQVYSHWKQTILMIYISAHETIFQLPDKCQAPYTFLYKIWYTHLQTMPAMSGTFCAHWYTEVIYSTWHGHMDVVWLCFIFINIFSGFVSYITCTVNPLI